MFGGNKKTTTRFRQAWIWFLFTLFCVLPLVYGAPETSTEPVKSVRDSIGIVKDLKDSVPVTRSRADTVVLVRHHFNHKEQIIAGGVVMACLAAMMAIMNNYNPR